MKMLEGIKVLDFTTNASGPKAGTYLADYGAEVVKVEVPGGEGGRKFAFYVNGISTYACGKDRGKKSIEIKPPASFTLHSLRSATSPTSIATSRHTISALSQ